MQRPWGSSMSDWLREEQRSRGRCKGPGAAACVARLEKSKGPGAVVCMTCSEKSKRAAGVGGAEGVSRRQRGWLERAQALQGATRTRRRQSPVECCQQRPPWHASCRDGRHSPPSPLRPPQRDAMAQVLGPCQQVHEPQCGQVQARSWVWKGRRPHGTQSPAWGIPGGGGSCWGRWSPEHSSVGDQGAEGRTRSKARCPGEHAAFSPGRAPA